MRTYIAARNNSKQTSWYGWDDTPQADKAAAALNSWPLIKNSKAFVFTNYGKGKDNLLSPFISMILKGSDLKIVLVVLGETVMLLTMPPFSFEEFESAMQNAKPDDVEPFYAGGSAMIEPTRAEA